MLGKIVASVVAALGAAFAVTAIVGKMKQGNSRYENAPQEKNPLEGKKVVLTLNENEPANADGVRGHLEAVGDSDYHPGFYEKYMKRCIDVILSFGGLVVLSPIFLVLIIAIKIDDPGPVLFVQKRVGQNKRYFKLHKIPTVQNRQDYNKLLAP